MANPVLGYVDCAHCGASSTVHREARGMRALYYRCYDEDGLSMRCGTVQIKGPAGQIWIRRHMRAAEPDKPAPAGPAPAEKPAPAGQPAKRGGFLAEGSDDD